MMRVLVLADSAIAREGLEAMLREDGRFEPVRSECTPGDLSRLALFSSGSQSDLVLAEISDKRRLLSILPSDNDASAPVAPVVLLVDVVNRNELQRILSGGVRAVLRRDATAGEIFAALEAAAAGLTTIGPDELDLLFPTSDAALLEDERVLEALSARETEVLALMARGLGNKNIASRLRISEHTVKFHVSSILAKLGAASRTEAVTIGLKEGLLVI